MPKLTRKALKQKAEELVRLKPLVEQYKKLEQELKAGLHQLGLDNVEVTNGQVKISTATLLTISPELATDVLGTHRANKIIQIKKSVPNSILKAFVKADEISNQEWSQLQQNGQKKTIIRLHVRPLK